MGQSKAHGFSLIELMIAVAIVGILAGIALPSYRSHVIRAARVQAQTELLELASLQEKIFLNNNCYTFGAAGVTTAYNGTAAALCAGAITGGLGRSSGSTKDGKYSLSLVTLASSLNCTGAGTATTVGAQAFVLMATPVAGGTQAGDGNLCISENGQRLWGTAPW